MQWVTDEAKRQLAFSANCVLACVRCLVLNKYFFERGALDFNFNN